MGCCGNDKKRSFVMNDLGKIDCPKCKKRVPRTSFYHSWCPCGAYIEIEAKTGKVIRSYSPEQLGLETPMVSGDDVEKPRSQAKRSKKQPKQPDTKDDK